jgi:hypothetical protein
MSNLHKQTKTNIITPKGKGEKQMSNAIERIKKLHTAMSIERKDISLKDLVAKEGKNGAVTIEIVGLASKYVPKYHNENNQGMHTMIYLKDGRKTGAFSNALYDFARFFYEGAQMDTKAEFNKIMFTDKGFLKVNVAVVELEKGKTTYNFEIMDGLVENVERFGNLPGNTPLLIEQTQK